MAEALSKIKAPERAMKLMAAELVADMSVAADRQSYLGLLAQVKGGAASISIGPIPRSICVMVAASALLKSLPKRSAASVFF